MKPCIKQTTEISEVEQDWENSAGEQICSTETSEYAI